MILFDVRCQVLEPIQVTDRSGHDVTIAPGYYRLRGLEHLVRKAGGMMAATGMDLSIIDADDGATAYTLSSEKLADFMAHDEVEIRI